MAVKKQGAKAETRAAEPAMEAASTANDERGTVNDDMPGPRPVTVTAPMKRVLTARGVQGYATTRVDVALNAVQAAALRDVFDGLLALGTWQKPNPNAGDAVRWLLDRLGEEFARRK